MRSFTALRTLVCALLASVAMLAIPTVADASSRQLSLIQDDAEMLGDRGEDPAAAMRELKALGVDVLRLNVLFYRVYKQLNHRAKPAGFDTSDPSESLYEWGPTDRVVALARANGVKLLLTISGPGPHWFSETPSRCRNNKLCTWRPKAKEFGAFVAAVAKRYRGQVGWYSLYNEPNLKEWIRPEITNTRAGRVETAGVYYRKLWSEGYKAIRQNDPGVRNRVLFGEVANISSPLPMLYASLCLDPSGRPFSSRLRRAHKCPARPARLNIGGYAIHPYVQGGFGTPTQPTSRSAALPIVQIPRLHRLMNKAAARRRTPGGRGIYITEFGFQSCPPDCSVSRVSLAEQARYINESDRLVFTDPRVKTVAQYQLVDVPDKRQYNSGLRFDYGRGARKKPSYEAYRLPLVVTKRSSRSVEVWGQVRPARFARTLGNFVKPEIQFARGGGFKTVARPNPNSAGIFRISQRRTGAASGRWRIRWQNTITGGVSFSRVAKAGKALRYNHS
jgi:hypothetical protein